MGRSTSLHPDAAGRRLGEETTHLAPAQLTRHRRRAFTLDRMHLEKVLRQVDPNPDKAFHGRLPYPRPPPATPWHLMPFGGGRPHHHREARSAAAIQSRIPPSWRAGATGRSGTEQRAMFSWIASLTLAMTG